MKKEETSTMKSIGRTTKRSGVLWALILSMMILSSAPAIGQGTETSVTGAGMGSFPADAAFNGIRLSGLELGQGIFIASDGTAQGEFHVVLLGKSVLGQPQEIVVDGKVSGGNVAFGGQCNFNGIATVDLGDGTSLPSVPFAVTLSGDSLALILGSTALPAASLNGGGVTIE